MTWLKVGKTVVTWAIAAFFAIYNLIAPLDAANATQVDVFAPKEQGVHKEIRKGWTRLDRHLRGVKRPAQQGLFVRDKWALTVGVSRYQDSSIKRLKVARNNALWLAAVLKEPMVGRFPSEHVASVVGRAATKSAIEDAILNSALVKKALPSDLILIYICGRVLPLVAEGDLCLCTYDTLASEADRSGVKLVETLANLHKRTQCAQMLCILDCIPVAKEDFANGAAVSLEELSRKTGVSILSANRFREEPAAYASSMFSPFTLYLTDGLRTSSGSLTLPMLVSYIQDNQQKQYPQLVQEVSFVPSEANPRAQEMVIGLPPRAVWSARNLSVGHSASTLAMDRPDLLTSPHGALLANGERKQPNIVNGKTPEDDAAEARFSPVNFGPWMDKMKRAIKAKWNPPKGLTQPHVVAIFTTLKDGSIVEPSIVQSSGEKAVDQSALEALKAASPLDPLPEGAPASVQIQYVFDWRVKAD
jgi:TonB family protein